MFSATVNTIPDLLPDITGNLMKMVTENTPGATSSYRDEVPFAIVPAVPLTLDKTVIAVDTPTYSPPVPFVQEGSLASYEIDVTHAGSAANGTDYSVRGLQVFDVLPQPVRCADVSALSNPLFVDCYDSTDPGHPSIAGDATRSVIVWDFVVDPGAVDAEALFVGDVKTLSYNILWPSGIGADATFTNTAGVRSFAAFTNEPGVGSTYYPDDNIDASVPSADWNAPAADDTASVRTRPVAVTKLFTSPILPGNTGPATPGTSGQAVIGEIVTYYYSVTIPAGTAVYGGRLTDALPSGWTVASPPTAPVASFTYEPDDSAPGVFAPAPANVVLDTSNGQLDFGVGTGGAYTNSSLTDQRFTVTVNVVVTGSGINQTSVNSNRNNIARFQAGTSPSGPTNAINRFVQRTVAVRQPTPSLTKTNDTGGASVAGGDTVLYTLTASQPNNRPTLYDSWIVDCLPDGLTFAGTVSTTIQVGSGAQTPVVFDELAPAAGPVDGCAAGTTRLGWRLDDLNQNTTIRVSYNVTVDLTAVGGDDYTNTAALTGSSLNDGNRVTPDVAPNRSRAGLHRSAVVAEHDFGRRVHPDEACRQVVGDDRRTGHLHGERVDRREHELLPDGTRRHAACRHRPFQHQSGVGDLRLQHLGSALPRHFRVTVEHRLGCRRRHRRLLR